MINVWVTDTNRVGALPRQLMNILDRSEEDRSNRMRSGADKRRFLIGRILLRQALSQTLGGDPRSWRFIIGDTGKVNLCYHEGFPLIDFNISHSGTAVAVAVSTSGNVGLDIERKNPSPFAEPVDAVFTPGELDHLQKEPENTRYQETMRLWTMKEAYAKLLSLGFKFDFAGFEVWPKAPLAFFETRDVKLDTDEFYLTIAAKSSSDQVVHLNQMDLLTENTTFEPAVSALMYV